MTNIYKTIENRRKKWDGTIGGIKCGFCQDRRAKRCEIQKQDNCATSIQ